MPATFRLEIKNPGLKNLPTTIRGALDGAGAAFQSEVKRYPPQDEVAPGTKYKRTGTLGNTASYTMSIGVGDYKMDVGGVKYMPYVVTDDNAEFKHWAGWPGKREKVIAEVKRGFRVMLKKLLHK